MRLFKKEPSFTFMNKRFYAFTISGLIILAGVYMFLTRGFNLGIDFTGGTLIEISFADKTNVDNLRSAMAKIGLEKAEIVQIGTENKFFIKTEKVPETGSTDKDLEEHELVGKKIKDILLNNDEKELIQAGKIDLNQSSEMAIYQFLRSKGISEDDSRDNAKKIIQARDNPSGLISDPSVIEKLDLKKRVLSEFKENGFLSHFTFLSSEWVGPKVGRDLRGQAVRFTLWALLGLLIYIAYRFRFIFGVSAVITILHDVLICLSFILFLNIEVSISVMAALLTIVGYSLNDTIVIFDRVRDNVKLMRKDNAEKILDRSINQTLSRTLVTSGTTLLTLLALFFLGGEVIHYFALTLIIGIFVGTYSSIFQSCAWLRIWEDTFLKRKKS